MSPVQVTQRRGEPNLPPNFDAKLRIGDVALSSDGSQYAVLIREKVGQVFDVPSDGVFDVQGSVYQVERKGDQVTLTRLSSESKTFLGISFSSRSRESVTGKLVSAGRWQEPSLRVKSDKGRVFRVQESGNPVFEFSLGENPDLTKREHRHSFPRLQKLTYRDSFNGVTLSLSNDEKTYVEGRASVGPQRVGSELVVKSLEDAKFALPKDGSVALDIGVSTGEVKGIVASPGRIVSMFGGIDIVLAAPMIIKAELPEYGNVHAAGMEADGGGHYFPGDGAQPRGILELDSNWDIRVTYKPEVFD